jgi:hypothetical protein
LTGIDPPAANDLAGISEYDPTSYPGFHSLSNLIQSDFLVWNGISLGTPVACRLQRTDRVRMPCGLREALEVCRKSSLVGSKRLAAERRNPGQEIEDEVKVARTLWMFRLHFSDWPVEDRPVAIVVTRLTAGLLRMGAPAILSAAQRNFAGGDPGRHYLAGNLVERHRSAANLQLRTGSGSEKRLRKLFLRLLLF